MKTTEPEIPLFTRVKDLGIPYDSHATDLYLPNTAQVRALLAEYPTHKANARGFTHQVHRTSWLDVPFAYLPGWPAGPRHGLPTTEDLEPRLTEILGPHCGLNADWAVSAWHLGPGATPNQHDGDLYLLDQEDGTWTVQQRHYYDVGLQDVAPVLALFTHGQLRNLIRDNPTRPELIRTLRLCAPQRQEPT